MSAAPSSRVILPPPSTRETVDKTAKRVAEKGEKFEYGLLANRTIMTNVTFSFLKPENPYHAYYRQKVEEYKQELRDQTPVVDTTPQATQPSGTTTISSFVSPETQTHSLLCAMLNEERPVPATDPLPLIHSLDADFSPTGNEICLTTLELMKHTAQYLVIYGEEFMHALMTHEKRNPYFDFLKDGHPRFHLFRHLFESYQRILRPSGGLVEALETQSTCRPDELLARCWDSALWQREKTRVKENQETQQAEEDKAAFQDADWSNFVVAATVEI